MSGKLTLDILLNATADAFPFVLLNAEYDNPQRIPLLFGGTFWGLFVFMDLRWPRIGDALADTVRV